MYKNVNTVSDGFSAHATARRVAIIIDDVIIIGRRLLHTYIISPGAKARFWAIPCTES